MLSTLDLRFSDAYQALRQQVGSQGTTEVFQEAVKFQSIVNATCNLPSDLAGFNPAPYTSCIQNLYLQQRAAWVRRLSEPAREETNLTAQQLLDAQSKLAAAGYLPAGSQIDGVYGPSTRTAIISFQLAKSIALTGFLDQATFDALFGVSISSGSPAVAEPAPPTQSQAQSAAEQLAIAKAEAAKAQAEAARAQADAAKAQAEAAAQIAITQRQAAESEAKAAAEAAAKQKAADEAKALQDAQGASP
jgi:peptidoglycan hydrolase-like protein with peptidoglycan-binding domain